MAADRPPSVDTLARSLAPTGLPHPVLVDVAREAIAAGDAASAPARAAEAARRLLGPVVNATGVLLHTNLGRAPLAVHAEAAYSNLELDLDTGQRGSRQDRVGPLLARACGAEAAVVVNNGAAALLLALAALAPGQRVSVSRGELIEIGGGFRIPDVLASSGAELVEVGTTNRTRLADYRTAGEVALALKVHPSNYRLTGFTESVSVRDLVTLGAPVLVDIGSGLLDAATPWLPAGPPPWLHGEPAARQTLDDGASLVTFSGDKLLGGPQAGVIAGRADLVATCAAHPLARALRPGSLVLGALQDVALAYLRREPDAIPFWRMATAPVELLRSRAIALGVGAVVDCASVTGGGTLPGVELASAGVALDGDRLATLRACDPPIIARVEDGRTICDLRTVDPADDAHLAAALKEP
ncbi:MAG: L-seryl-tRNA(Ser) seleniumtransferase [Actinomycetota bacterium]|nr:L-seryl-tRNA(Ser) seleniumtransferase [Actinomycetota bacterium]